MSWPTWHFFLFFDVDFFATVAWFSSFTFLEISELTQKITSKLKGQKKNSREFSYTFFFGSESMIFLHLCNFVETQSCTLELCGNTYLHTTHLWKHKKIYFPKNPDCGNTKLPLVTLCFHKVGFSWHVLEYGHHHRTEPCFWIMYTQKLLYLYVVFVPLHLGDANIFIYVRVLHLLQTAVTSSKTLPALLFDVFWRDIVKPL